MSTSQVTATVRLSLAYRFAMQERNLHCRIYPMTAYMLPFIQHTNAQPSPTEATIVSQKHNSATGKGRSGSSNRRSLKTNSPIAIFRLPSDLASDFSVVVDTDRITRHVRHLSRPLGQTFQPQIISGSGNSKPTSFPQLPRVER